MSRGNAGPLRVGVIGGGPAGSFFALYALDYAARLGREVSVTIYEGKDFRRFGQPGCNMCAGIIPVSVLDRFTELRLSVPPELVLSRISSYSLHTSAGSLSASQPDPRAQIISVYRGAGPRYGHPPDLLSFDEFLVEQAVARGAKVRRTFVEVVRKGHPVEVESGGQTHRYDVVVLATGVNGRSIDVQGFCYGPPPKVTMCQAELYLGQEEVQRRLGSSVHIFLPRDDIATYGILIPKGPYVAVSLLNPRSHMRSLRQFLQMDEVTALLGSRELVVCGCLPRISVGMASNFVDDGFVAVGDASVTRLYKNGIGSALATAERAAWTVVYHGCSRQDFVRGYIPLCKAIDMDNRMGRLLYLEVPVLKRFGVMPMAHYRLATESRWQRGVSEQQMRILWGMFTGAYTYRDLFRMSMSPSLVFQLALALGETVLKKGAGPPAVHS